MVHRLLRAAIAAVLVVTCAPDLRARPQKPSLPGYPAPGGEAIVTVLEPGTAPRTQLRYQLRPPHQEAIDLTMQMGMTMSIGGMAVPVDLPPFTLSARADITDVASNGDASYAIAFTKLTVAPGGNEAVSAALKQSEASMTSVKGSGVVSNRGVPRSMKMDTSGITDPTMKQTFDQMASSFQNMSMPLPEEAVGVGARWEVRTAIDSGGASIFQKTEYEIVALDGHVLTLKAKVEQTAPPQSVNVPNLPPGVDASLSKMTGSGTGTVSLRLNALTPTSAMESATSMSMDVSMNGQTQSVTTQIKLKVTIAPGK